MNKQFTWEPSDGVEGHGIVAQVFDPDGEAFFDFFEIGPEEDKKAEELCRLMNETLKPKITKMTLGEVGAIILTVFPKATQKQKVAVFDAFLDKFKIENPRVEP